MAVKSKRVKLTLDQEKHHPALAIIQRENKVAKFDSDVILSISIGDPYDLYLLDKAESLVLLVEFHPPEEVVEKPMMSILDLVSFLTNEEMNEYVSSSEFQKTLNDPTLYSSESWIVYVTDIKAIEKNFKVKFHSALYNPFSKRYVTSQNISVTGPLVASIRPYELISEAVCDLYFNVENLLNQLAPELVNKTDIERVNKPHKKVDLEELDVKVPKIRRKR